MHVVCTSDHRSLLLLLLLLLYANEADLDIKKQVGTSEKMTEAEKNALLVETKSKT